MDPRLRGKRGPANLACWDGPAPSSRGRNRLLCFGDSIEMTPAVPGGGELMGPENPQDRDGAGDGRAAPEGAAPRCARFAKKPLNFVPPLGCSRRRRGRGAAGASACPCVFPAGEQVQRSAHHIKTPFPYSYALFFTSRFY